MPTPRQLFRFSRPAIPGAATPAERELHGRELSQFAALPMLAEDYEDMARTAEGGLLPDSFMAEALREEAARLRAAPPSLSRFMSKRAARKEVVG